MRALRTCLLAAAATIAIGAQAHAQGAPYKLEGINFDMWCQEEQRLPPERCDKRLPQDDADYRAYVAKIENYEIQYLQKKRDEENLDRVILHNDPIDHPTQPSTPQINQVDPPPSASPY